MAQEYLPAPSNVRLADLMKEHNISQPELAKEIGCSKSTISRFISGAKRTLTHEQVLKIARLFNVSTDFLLGETNIPDRKNYDIAELGLSVEAAKNLYTGACQCRGGQSAAGKCPLCRTYLPHIAVF
ncbi:MAG: helix-turn-helix domain-containing protein [Faecalibacterium sp.]